MSNYTIGELEDIIERGEEKIAELEDLSNRIGGSDDGLEALIEGLIARVEELREELEEINEQMAEGYEADCSEALDLYVEQGGELNDDGDPVDEDMFRDVFFEMQVARVENGI